MNTVNDPARGVPVQPVRTVAVLGGGPGGLVAAEAMARRGFAVTVIDAADRLGGTMRSEEIGPYSFDAGSIFFEERATIFDLAEGLRERCPQVIRRQRRIAPDGVLRAYPFAASEIPGWGAVTAARAVGGMFANRLSLRRDGTLDTICRIRLGGTLYHACGLHSYIERFNRLDPRLIHEEFFFRRMSFVERATQSRAMLDAMGRALAGRARGPRPEPARRTLRIRPRAGFGAMFDPIRARLEATGVRFRLGERLRALRPNDRGFVLTTDAGTTRWDEVVGAIPADALHRALFGEASGLQSIGMVTLFVSARHLARDGANVLFNFHPQGLWKRITVYSDLYPESDTDRDFFSVEVTQAPGSTPDPERDFADLCAHLAALGLAEGLRLEGHVVLPHAYPLYHAETGDRAGAVIDRIAATGVIPVGRQGRFEYLPTSSGVARRVREEIGRADPGVVRDDAPLPPGREQG